jgi:hypothetical protein
MRTTVAFLVAVLLCASARAQSPPPPDSHKVIKVIIGASALAIGAVVTAKSSQTTTVTSPLGVSETSSFSTSQMVTGLVIAGVGAIILWEGIRDRSPTSPSTAVGVALGKRSTAIVMRRTW